MSTTATAHGATGTATGVGGETLSAASTSAPASPTCPAARRTGRSPTSPATTTTQRHAAIVINKADATVTVTGYTGVYDGAAHGATGTAPASASEALAGLDLGASFTNVPGGTATWTFTDVTGNYNNAAVRPPSCISKADATVHRQRLHRRL